MIETTEYYDEFLRYFELAKDQQAKTNLGWVPYADSTYDPLMQNVQLYDVVERRYAGFSQIVHDIFYGWTSEHPYWDKMQAGFYPHQRYHCAMHWNGKQDIYDLPEWLYLFLLHRITGSAINYATIPSGYHNTILVEMWSCDTIEEMVEMIAVYPKPFYTSVGYQFPRFPKRPEGSHHRRGGDYYLSEYAPRLAREMAEWLQQGSKRDFREMGKWMQDWNTKNGLSAYHFQYAAFLADIADWFPQYVNRSSMFFYGSNARECISYLATPTTKMKKDDFLDEVMMKIQKDCNSMPYNAEDICCDFIRWVENYVHPGSHYKFVDRDKIWSSCEILDHPCGRQRGMLELGLVDSFNTLTFHPSDLKVLEANELSIYDYQTKVKQLLYDEAQERSYYP